MRSLFRFPQKLTEEFTGDLWKILYKSWRRLNIYYLVQIELEDDDPYRIIVTELSSRQLRSRVPKSKSNTILDLEGFDEISEFLFSYRAIEYGMYDIETAVRRWLNEYEERT
jgi:hypothetical protein